MRYSPPWWLKNGHLQSIYPSLLRRLDDSFLTRVRLTTKDDDFLDLDQTRCGYRRALVLSHGLEGHSRRPYMLGMAKAALASGWDIFLWNFRACSGSPNRHLKGYHSGQTEDLNAVIQYVSSLKYQEISLLGFSMGGNKTLIYLGDRSISKPAALNAAVVFSVPVDLPSSSLHLARPKNWLYMQNFLSSFRQKLQQKQALFPGQIDLRDFNKIRNFQDYDERYTAPMHGFSSAKEYWQQSSSRPYLKTIEHPTLMVSALDDPFLTPECFPLEILRNHPAVRIETPEHGGHVGFMPESMGRQYWSEQRAMQFLNATSAMG